MRRNFVAFKAPNFPQKRVISYLSLTTETGFLPGGKKDLVFATLMKLAVLSICSEFKTFLSVLSCGLNKTDVLEVSKLLSSIW